MSNLAWWLIPIGATILAVAWAALRSRPAKPTQAADAMENLRRLNDAMERPMPTQTPIPGPEAGRSSGLGK
ncbi:MAG: hypothetical protein F2797_01055 [Actinobacteria bacterium]|uniref:Unannotated protein n=1 Tax=freshwater metagenome TaxID=449393 RepID=A0A6J7CVB7_9ZZZZ|nr:hypothetical protein [Actinomycetota bacterium]MSX12911.1 hypothetical protein [Actinomycetota bacterium]